VADGGTQIETFGSRERLEDVARLVRRDPGIASTAIKRTGAFTEEA